MLYYLHTIQELTDMKRLFALAIGLLCAFYADAQVTGNLLATFNTTTLAISGADSAITTNTGTAALYTGRIPRGSLLTLVAVVTETSGTSGGTIVPQGSIDGVNWVTLAAAQTAGNSASYTVTDSGTQNCAFIVMDDKNGFNYYRLFKTGSGTMADRFKAKWSYVSIK